jgi:uroporphyrinogen III methyltransferase/synthase
MPEGRVHLLGAGPGDPGLLTLRGRELLAAADVVVYDRLVHGRLLAWCRPGCERICVGKRAGGRSTGQEAIEALLVEHARAGRRVVRLKGGDPCVFGRGGEEAARLAAEGIPFEIVPGVTASLAAGAFAGIPLTHRDAASTLVFATGHEDAGRPGPAVDWRALGALRGSTICIYMGMTRLEFVLAELRAGGLAAETPAACVQWASLGAQRTVAATAASLPEAVRRAGLEAPGVVIVGEVVRLREELAWFEKRPLFGRRVAVTRNRDQAGETAWRLEALGATVLELPLVRVVAAPDREACAEVFAEFGSYDWIVFTSANGVRFFFDLFFAAFKDIRALGAMRIAAVGESTARALRELHLEVEIVPEQPVAEALARALVDTGSLDNAKVLLVAPHESRDVLMAELSAARAIVDRLPVYRTEKTDLSGDPVAADFRRHGADAVLFTSSSGVQSFAAQAAALTLADGAKRPLVGSIGPVTSETARAAGLPVDFEAATASLDALAEALVAALTRGAGRAGTGRARSVK